MLRFALLCLWLPSALMAQNNDWPKAIAAVSARSEAYITYGLRESGAGSIQSAIGVIGIFADIEKHRCAILGRMLGKIDVIAELERFDIPPLSQNPDPYLAVEIGVSLDNWIAEARTALAQSEAERINTWNLDCVGTLVPESAGIVSDAPDAQFVADGTALRIYGNIDSGFHARFLETLNANPDIRMIELGSGGGSVKDAIEAGREIRRRGLETRLFGNCYSACPLVYVGGSERTIWANVRHDFGFHRLATRDGAALPDDHPFYDLIASYLAEMGVDAETYIGWMQSAAPESMFSPQPGELCAPGIATFVQRICNADGTF